MPTTDLRPLSTGELLDKTFSLYRAHFKLFVGIMLLPQLFVFALGTLGDVLPKNNQTPTDIFAFTLGVFVVAGVFLLAYGLMYALALAATVYAVSEVYLGRETSILRAFGQVRRFALRTLWMLLVLMLAMGLGFLLFVVPGVLVALWYAVAIPAAVVENLKTGAAFRRSEKLTKGRRGTIFLLFVLFFVLNYVAAFLFEVPASLLVQFWPGVGSMVLKNFATLASGALVGPLLTIGLSLIYFDLRVRKEGFDLQVMMASLEPKEPPPLPSSAT